MLNLSGDCQGGGWGVGGGIKVNTDPELFLPAALTQMHGEKAGFSDEGVDAYRGWCTFQSVHFDGSMFACLQDVTLPAPGSSPPGGRLRLRGFFYLQVCVSHIRAYFFLLGFRCVFIARRLDICRRKGLKTQSCHCTGDSAIYCKTVVYDTSSTGEKNFS